VTKTGGPARTYGIRSQGRNGICAVTTLHDDIFIVRYDSQHIEVYDDVTFALQRRISVPGLGSWPNGLTTCSRHMYLYLSDYDNDIVRRVELVGSNPVMRWSVDSGPEGLSVNRAHNLVVTCRKAEKLQEYTSHGSLVKEICLQACSPWPWHAVQLSTGQYAVSHSTSPGVVSVVGADGELVHSYEPSETAADVGRMECPTSLAVTSNDDILVADEDNNRILSINRLSGCVQELSLPVDGKIQEPRALCLDESRRRLYVGEWSGDHRLLVFDYVTELSVIL